MSSRRSSLRSAFLSRRLPPRAQAARAAALLRRDVAAVHVLGRHRRVLRLSESRLREREDGVDADGEQRRSSRRNEPWHVSGPGTHALQLGPGATALSSPLPVSLLDPWVRFFARSARRNGPLRVQVLFHGLLGNLTGLLNVGTLSAASVTRAGSRRSACSRARAASRHDVGAGGHHVAGDVGQLAGRRRLSRPLHAEARLIRTGRRHRPRHAFRASVLSMATRAATPWGPADLVEELTVPQQAGTKRFASKVQLLETAKGERLVRFSYAGAGRRHARAGDSSRARHRTAESRPRPASRAGSGARA